MTNEQTALLITQYHRQLVGIFNRLSEALTDVEGLGYCQSRGKWKGEGERPSAWGDGYWNPDNWEWLDNKNKPVCLDALSEFVDLVEDDIKGVLGKG